VLELFEFLFPELFKKYPMDEYYKLFYIDRIMYEAEKNKEEDI
jgi:hypothetical protein